MIFLWHCLAHSLTALCFTLPLLSCCFVLNTLCTRPLSLSFLFCLLHCIVLQTPPFGVPSFQLQQELGLGSSGCCSVGVRQILLSGYEGVSRTQGHPCPFSPLSRLVARPLASCFLSHSLTRLASFSSFLLAFASHTPFRIPAISPFPFKPSFFFSRCSN